MPGVPGMQTVCWGVFALWVVAVALFVRFGHFRSVADDDGAGASDGLDVSDVVTLPGVPAVPAVVAIQARPRLGRSGGLGRQSRAHTRTLDGQESGGVIVCDRPQTPQNESSAGGSGEIEGGAMSRVLGRGYVFASGRFVELSELQVLIAIIPRGWLN